MAVAILSAVAITPVVSQPLDTSITVIPDKSDPLESLQLWGPIFVAFASLATLVFTIISGRRRETEKQREELCSIRERLRAVEVTTEVKEASHACNRSGKSPQ